MTGFSFGTYACGHCGKPVSKDAASCPYCGVLLTGIRCQACKYIGSSNDFVNDHCPRCGAHTERVVPAPPPPPRPPRPPRPTRPSWQKSPAAHAWASVALPGLGSMLCGRRNRGLLILGLSVACLFGVTLLADALIDGPPTGIGAFLAFPVWIWGIVDAYRAAEQWNREHPGPPSAPQQLSRPQAQPMPPPVPAPMPMPAAQPAWSAAVPADGATAEIHHAAAQEATPAPVEDPLVAELIEIGRRERYAGPPGEVYDEHWNHRRARQIGTLLDERGGMELMLAAHSRIEGEFSGSAGPRELAACWGGVGQWR